MSRKNPKWWEVLACIIRFSEPLSITREDAFDWLVSSAVVRGAARRRMMGPSDDRMEGNESNRNRKGMGDGGLEFGVGGEAAVR